MPLIAILVAALAIGFEQLVQWKYGPMGIIAFVALVFGTLNVIGGFAVTDRMLGMFKGKKEVAK